MSGRMNIFIIAFVLLRITSGDKFYDGAGEAASYATKEACLDGCFVYCGPKCQSSCSANCSAGVTIYGDTQAQCNSGCFYKCDKDDGDGSCFGKCDDYCYLWELKDAYASKSWDTIVFEGCTSNCKTKCKAKYAAQPNYLEGCHDGCNYACVQMTEDWEGGSGGWS